MFDAIVEEELRFHKKKVSVKDPKTGVFAVYISTFDVVYGVVVAGCGELISWICFDQNIISLVKFDVILVLDEFVSEAIGAELVNLNAVLLFLVTPILVRIAVVIHMSESMGVVFVVVCSSYGVRTSLL